MRVSPSPSIYASDLEIICLFGTSPRSVSVNCVSALCESDMCAGDKLGGKLMTGKLVTSKEKRMICLFLIERHSAQLV